MVYSSVGYCSCGQEIWIEFIRASSGWSVRFSDDNNPELIICPECRKVLKEEDLESK